MHYMIVTKRYERGTGKVRPPYKPTEFRYVVETLEEAKNWACDNHWPNNSFAESTRFRDQVDALPESGGTIKLPDGTIIEVKPTN